MSGVKAITGATGEDFEKLRETAINLGASTSFSSCEAAQAMTEMAKAGWSTTQIIDGMSGVLDATAASVTLGNLINTSHQWRSQWGWTSPLFEKRKSA